MSGTIRVRTRYQYSDQYKIQAVELSLENDVQVKQVVESLELHPMMLSRWRKEYREGKFKGGKRQLKRLIDESQKPGKVAALERELVRLQQENEILKKWQRFLATQDQSDLSS